MTWFLRLRAVIPPTLQWLGNRKSVTGISASADFSIIAVTFYNNLLVTAFAEMSRSSRTHRIYSIRPIIQMLSSVLKRTTQEKSESNILATSPDHMENSSPEANVKRLFHFLVMEILLYMWRRWLILYPDSVKQPFDYYICFDVEATCEEGRDFNYANEIIEFPAILIDSKTFDIVCCWSTFSWVPFFFQS